MHKRGFTLIELLVVIAIIGILASIVLVSLDGARKKGRDARRIADIKSIQLALETYYNDNLKYPLTLTSIAPTYVPTVPTDPTTGVGYSYSAFNSGGTSNCTASPATIYHLGAVLEVPANDGTGNFSQDADTPLNAGNCSGSAPDFQGLSMSCLTTGGNGANGAALSLENCYDVRSQ